MDNWSRWGKEQKLLVADSSSAPTWGQAKEIRDSFLLQGTAPRVTQGHFLSLLQSWKKIRQQSCIRKWTMDFSTCWRHAAVMGSPAQCHQCPTPAFPFCILLVLNLRICQVGREPTRIIKSKWWLHIEQPQNQALCLNASSRCFLNSSKLSAMTTSPRRPKLNTVYSRWGHPNAV